jgi:hypothetical protein
VAHFAQIIDDKVVQVIVISDDDCGGGLFPDSEKPGQEFIASLGLGGEWRQTSYNNNFRGLFAGIDYTFDRANNVFVAPEHMNWDVLPDEQEVVE